MRQKTVGLVDYGSGNLRSVRKALEICGARVRIVNHPDEFANPVWEILAVPGVSSFGDCAESLHRTGLWKPILQWLHEGHPYLGICLGYQLLFESSEESPDIPGFGILAGRVVRFRDDKLKVPHMGWNQLIVHQPALFNGLSSPINVYFVHSYYPVPENEDVITSTCEYGSVRFASSIALGNIVGTQFHPEKSQSTGLQFLTNFLRTSPKR
ncbi:MAG: imidazole glycerol phosphate synthase subunit HisH [Verrucomicrobia bacterium]|nr:MAG: imidazole glycerol phosphate synthase subunit HisH [Verrucomicrobiota bacterium]